ncbi:hypothetical protein P8452_61499 [Trifolium repens]|nr:hypothetical protein P8452_61499 [Trifolium repens]
MHPGLMVLKTHRAHLTDRVHPLTLLIFRKKKEAFIVELVRLHQNTELGRRFPVYDGGKNLYTAGSLPFTHKEFNIVLNEDDEGASNTSYVSLGRLLYSLGSRMSDLLRLLICCGVEECYLYPPTLTLPSLAFIEPLPLIDTVAQILGKDVYSKPITDADRVKIKKALKEMIFAFPPNRFPLDEKMNMQSIVDYFQEMYRYTIMRPHLPCIQVGSEKKTNYLPMEEFGISADNKLASVEAEVVPAPWT